MRVTVLRSVLLIAVIAGILFAIHRFSTLAPRNAAHTRKTGTVTPVEGPSWLKHLGLALDESRLGQNGGTAEVSAAVGEREPDLAQGDPNEELEKRFPLSGADLYRMECRSCHGPDGRGAPPEIHSLIGPVQGTSAALIQRRMEERGASIGADMANQMAQQAEQAIRDRLEHGGKKMADFHYLRPEEVTALLSYLDELAAVPGKRSREVVQESAAHVGEDVAKGTCHICHSATGPGGSRMQVMMRGIVPSLATLPYDHSLDAVLDQVHNGTRSGMGMGMMMMRGNRMPALPYFTDPEITAAYLYLEAYPPQK